MKHTLLLLSCAFTVSTFAQSTVKLTSTQYTALKANHQLVAGTKYAFTDNAFKQVHYQGPAKSPSTICSCMVPLDSTFTVAMAPNDDGSTGLISIPFSFNFYGNSYSGVYINNNGNISLVSSYYTFTSTPFPDSTYIMVAPFWGDVDTRDSAAGGNVYYQISPTHMIVKWEAVGYYPVMADKLNTFQLIITDGTDPILPSGTNVGFCYGDMQWTTGSASGGINGFGGTPATVGVNAGTGLDYFQVGRFDSAGVVFDGPYGNNDQVDWLDNQGMYFNTSILGNVPPVIINNNICDTIDVYTGDTTHSVSYDVVNFTISATTPEIGQTIVTTITSSAPSALTVNQVANKSTFQQFDCSFSAVGMSPGIYTITATATDNGTPAQTTTRTIYVRTNYDPTAPTGITEANKTNEMSVYPNPSNGMITISHSFSLSSEPSLGVKDVLGKTVIAAALTSSQQQIDINALPKGIYFATITSKDGVSKTMKIVKK